MSTATDHLFLGVGGVGNVIGGICTIPSIQGIFIAKLILTSSGFAGRVGEAGGGVGHGLHDTLALVLSIVGVATGTVRDFLGGRLAVT